MYFSLIFSRCGGMADAVDLGSIGLTVRVRVPPSTLLYLKG